MLTACAEMKGRHLDLMWWEVKHSLKVVNVKMNVVLTCSGDLFLNNHLLNVLDFIAVSFKKLLNKHFLSLLSRALESIGCPAGMMKYNRLLRSWEHVVLRLAIEGGGDGLHLWCELFTNAFSLMLNE